MSRPESVEVLVGWYAPGRGLAHSLDVDEAALRRSAESVTRMSRAQARLLGVDRCPTCSAEVDR